jgi:hypothetical protein
MIYYCDCKNQCNTYLHVTVNNNAAPWLAVGYLRLERAETTLIGLCNVAACQEKSIHHEEKRYIPKHSARRTVPGVRRTEDVWNDIADLHRGVVCPHPERELHMQLALGVAVVLGVFARHRKKSGTCPGPVAERWLPV